MSKKVTQLTETEREKVLSGTSYVMPNNPSDKGWNADQIRKKGYEGTIQVFDYLQKAVEQVGSYVTTNDSEVSTLKGQMSKAQNDISDNSTNISQVINRVGEIEFELGNLELGDGFATKEDIENVIEIAEGKTKTIVIDLHDERNRYHTGYNSTFRFINRKMYNVNDLENEVPVEMLFSAGGSTLMLYETGLGTENESVSILYEYQKEEPLDLSKLKIGDILLLRQTDVPDFWLGGVQANEQIGLKTYTFTKLETTKVDLSNVVYKTGDETISGAKTFTSNVNLTSTVGESPYINFTNTYGTAFLRLSGYAYQFAQSFSLQTGKIYPYGNGTYNLGNDGNKWNNVYFAGFAGYDEKNSIEFDTANNRIKFNVQYGFSYKMTNSSFTPMALRKDLGDSNYYWNKGYINELISTGDAQYKKTICLTQDEYDALSTKDENVLYLIKE